VAICTTALPAFKSTNYQLSMDKGIEQVLIITEGKGIVATDQEEITVVPGDIVFIPANEKHWHGAAKDSAFSHLYVMAPEQKTTQLEE
jgi:quercetin dioxygenase-like cupin family protein